MEEDLRTTPLGGTAGLGPVTTQVFGHLTHLPIDISGRFGKGRVDLGAFEPGQSHYRPSPDRRLVLQGRQRQPGGRRESAKTRGRRQPPPGREAPGATWPWPSGPSPPCQSRSSSVRSGLTVCSTSVIRAPETRAFRTGASCTRDAAWALRPSTQALELPQGVARRLDHDGGAVTEGLGQLRCQVLRTGASQPTRRLAAGPREPGPPKRPPPQEALAPLSWPKRQVRWPALRGLGHEGRRERPAHHRCARR